MICSGASGQVNAEGLGLDPGVILTGITGELFVNRIIVHTPISGGRIQFPTRHYSS